MSDHSTPDGAVILDQTIDAGRPWSGVVEPGQRLRIIDLEGRQGVDFLCYNAARPEERYHAPNTLKAALTLRLGAGHRLYSDEARPIFTIIEDTYGGHDTIGGCCSAPSNAMLYGVEDCPGCCSLTCCSWCCAADRGGPSPALAGRRRKSGKSLEHGPRVRCSTNDTIR